MAALPIGYVFKPSKTELINYFLKNRLSNQPCNSIFDYDVYSKHSYDVLESTKGRSGMMEGYFFTSLKKSAKVKLGGTRKSRRIGEEGTWSGKSKVTPVLDENGKEIGSHRYYKFEPNDKFKDMPKNRLKWKMHEYSLDDKEDMVVCYITGEDDDRDKNNCSASSSKRPLYEDNIGSNYEIGKSSKRGCFQLDPMPLMVRQDQAYDFRPHDICQDQQIPISHVNENPSFDFGNVLDLGFLRSIGQDILPHNICQDQQFPMTMPYEVHPAQEQDFWPRHICQDQQFPTRVNENPSSDIDDIIKQIDFGGEVQERVDKEKSENEALAKEIEGLVDDDEKKEVDDELLRLLLASDGNNKQAVNDLMDGSQHIFQTFN